MRLGRGGAESGPAVVARVVRILEEYVGSLPATDPDEPCGFVRSWMLTRNVSDESLAGTSLQIGCSVVRRFDDERPDEVDDQRTYEQLVGCAAALSAQGFGAEEVYEGWRTVALDLRLPAGVRTAAVNSGDSVDSGDTMDVVDEERAAGGSGKSDKPGKKRLRGLRRPEPAATV